jgi:hypothetical protein
LKKKGLLTALNLKGGFKMLGYWRPHKEYQQFVRDELSIAAKLNPFQVYEYETAISKLYILDLDVLKEIISECYSHTGRPSNLQPEVFRSLVLMTMFKESPETWYHKLLFNGILKTVCGFGDWIPSVSSHYDFINRIVKLDEKPRIKRRKKKPKKKLKKGEKLPPKRKGTVVRETHSARQTFQ